MSVAVTTAIPLKASVEGVRVRVGVSAAMAGPSEKARTARAHTDTGNAYFNLEKYKEAIGEFEQAYLDKQDPAIFFNIGECHRLLGNNAEAIRFLRRFLQETHNHPNRVKAEERLADLERAGAVPPPAVVVPPPARPTLPPPAVTPVPVTTTPVAPPPAPPQPVTPVPVAPPPAPALAPGVLAISVTPAPAPSSTPVYKEWWFWTAIGAVVVAGVVVGVAASAAPSRPGCPAGVVCQ